MNGAEQILQTLVDHQIDTIFANPGTSEMQFVSALDRITGVRPVLGLFEGVCTGAADGYSRMSGKCGATLLHLGPGLANGLANLHNARRAGSSIVNIVGDHTRDHRGLDAPLASDIASLAAPMSHEVHTVASPESVRADMTAAIDSARQGNGRVVTVIVPADVSWLDSPDAQILAVGDSSDLEKCDEAALAHAIGALRKSSDKVLILVGGPALHSDLMIRLDAVRARTKCRIATPTFNARMPRGADRPEFERVPYLSERATAFFADVDTLILIGTRPPVNFFGYPGQASTPLKASCHIIALASPSGDARSAVDELFKNLVTKTYTRPAHSQKRPMRPDKPTGPLNAASLATALQRHMPENAIIVDEAITSGGMLLGATRHCGPHDWLDLTGGSIGQGIPLATGAAIACPQRKVIAIVGDGSALYTIQALWTQAREKLDIVTLICNNAAYKILQLEMDRTQATSSGNVSASTLSLDRPRIDFTKLAQGFGVPATSAHDAGSLDDLLRQAIETPGPVLIDAIFEEA